MTIELAQGGVPYRCYCYAASHLSKEHSERQERLRSDGWGTVTTLFPQSYVPFATWNFQNSQVKTATRSILLNEGKAE